MFSVLIALATPCDFPDLPLDFPPDFPPDGLPPARNDMPASRDPSLVIPHQQSAVCGRVHSRGSSQCALPRISAAHTPFSLTLRTDPADSSPASLTAARIWAAVSPRWPAPCPRHPARIAPAMFSSRSSKKMISAPCPAVTPALASNAR